MSGKLTTDEINRHLRYMERLREDANEAETEAERRQLLDDYRRLWAIVKPALEAQEQR